jgi:hypothetical protein
VVLTVSSSLLLVSQLRAEGFGVVPAATTEAYIQFGQENDKMAQSAGLDIGVKESEGSIANIHRMVNAEMARLASCSRSSWDFLVDRPIPGCDASPHGLG